MISEPPLYACAISLSRKIGLDVIYSCVVERLLINLYACRADMCGDSRAKPIRAVASEEALAYRDNRSDNFNNIYLERWNDC